jgi:hypothetical protein
MTLLWCDSFEKYATGTSDLSRVYDCVSATVIDTDKRTGSQCVNVANFQGHITPPIFTFPNQEFVVGFSVKNLGNYVPLFQTVNGTQPQIQIVLETSGRLTYTRSGGPVFGETYISDDTWYYIEIKGKVTNSTSVGDCELRINGKTEIVVPAGSNTQNTSPPGITTIDFCYGSTYSNVLFDDIYICDTQGTYNNDFLGECVVALLRPNANGIYSQWVGSDGNSTDNYLMVDEPYFNTSEYIESSTLNEMDSFNFQSLPTSALEVKGIQLSFYGTRTSAGDRRVTPFTRVSGSDYLTNELALGVNDNYNINNVIIETNPNTGILWTESDIVNLEAGFKITT